MEQPFTNNKSLRVSFFLFSPLTSEHWLFICFIYIAAFMSFHQQVCLYMKLMASQSCNLKACMCLCVFVGVRVCIHPYILCWYFHPWICVCVCVCVVLCLVLLLQYIPFLLLPLSLVSEPLSPALSVPQYFIIPFLVDYPSSIIFGRRSST